MTLPSIKGLILNGPARALSTNEPSPNGHGEIKTRHRAVARLRQVVLTGCELGALPRTAAIRTLTCGDPASAQGLQSSRLLYLVSEPSVSLLPHAPASPCLCLSRPA